MIRIVLLALVLASQGCGYRPAAGRVAAGVEGRYRYAPFLVRNDTPELALTHVVLESSRSELGRRGLLAAAPDEDTLQVELRLRSFSEVPASYSPAGEVIEYFGEVWLEYRVYAEAVTGIPVASGGERLTYRYDYRTNPQNVRVYRYAAVGNAVRDWIPVFTWKTAAGLRFPPPAPAAVTGTAVTSPLGVTAPAERRLP